MFQVRTDAQVTHGVAVAAVVERAVHAELHHDDGFHRLDLEHLAATPPSGEEAPVPGMPTPAGVSRAPTSARASRDSGVVRATKRRPPTASWRPSSSVAGAPGRPVTPATSPSAVLYATDLGPAHPLARPVGAGNRLHHHALDTRLTHAGSNQPSATVRSRVHGTRVQGAWRERRSKTSTSRSHRSPATRPGGRGRGVLRRRRRPDAPAQWWRPPQRGGGGSGRAAARRRPENPLQTS